VKRDGIVPVALPGAYDNPRPALVVQSDLFDALPSVTIAPITRELREAPLFRITLQPDAGNGLKKASQVMIDKMQTVPRSKLGEPFGRVDGETMVAVTRALAVFLGIA
jgi:mRNA interferase MazF